MKIIKLLQILLFMLILCKKPEDIDLGIVKDFDIKAGWPDIAIVTLEDGRKLSLPGQRYVSTGMHLHIKDGFFSLEAR
jgi:hypothetical protein